MVNIGRIACGSPETVADTIVKWCEEAGCGRVNVVCENGDMPEWKTVKNMTMFAEEVVPRIQAKLAENRAGERPSWPGGATDGGFKEERYDINGIDTAVLTAGRGRAAGLLARRGHRARLRHLLPLAGARRLIVPTTRASGTPPTTRASTTSRTMSCTTSTCSTSSASTSSHSPGIRWAGTSPGASPSRSRTACAGSCSPRRSDSGRASTRPSTSSASRTRRSCRCLTADPSIFPERDAADAGVPRRPLSRVDVIRAGAWKRPVRPEARRSGCTA